MAGQTPSENLFAGPHGYGRPMHMLSCSWSGLLLKPDAASMLCQATAIHASPTLQLRWLRLEAVPGTHALLAYIRASSCTEPLLS